MKRIQNRGATAVRVQVLQCALSKPQPAEAVPGSGRIGPWAYDSGDGRKRQPLTLEPLLSSALPHHHPREARGPGQGG